MPLTNTQLKNSKPTEKTQRLFDGGGLYLEISPKGGKWWRYKYRIRGKEKRISLGTYPEGHQLAHAVKDPNGRAYNRTAHYRAPRKTAVFA